jgi:hypothetical protein
MPCGIEEAALGAHQIGPAGRIPAFISPASRHRQLGRLILFSAHDVLRQCTGSTSIAAPGLSAWLSLSRAVRVCLRLRRSDSGGPSGGANALRMTLPFAVAENELLDLASGCLRQRPELDGVGTLEMSEALSADATISSAVVRAPALKVTKALGRSPQYSSGTPIPAHSSTPGWATIVCSTSMLEMF